MTNPGPEAAETRAVPEEEVDLQSIILTDSHGVEILVSAGRIPNTDTTLVFSLPFVDSRSKKDSVHIGTFMGIIPDKSDLNWKTFEQEAVRIASSGPVVKVVDFSERVTQIKRDEQQYARQMSHR